MLKKLRPLFFVLLFLGVGLVIAVAAAGAQPAVLNPEGSIAAQQLHLMKLATFLMLIVVIPVFALTIGISLRYRAGNTKATYKPKWESNLLLESIWWGLPCLIILAIGGLIIKSSHDLDPYRPIESSVRPVTVQVVALQWKWLFIYPDQGIATVNYLEIPKGTPINFVITADAPMNSFWIPQLGGQVYAMSGMSTKLHLIADQEGEYEGSSANISGEGFAGMKFKVRSVSKNDFDQWALGIGSSGASLDSASYASLARPSADNPVTYYSLGDPDIYQEVVGKFMSHGNGNIK